jgi:hypothetical protein
LHAGYKWPDLKARKSPEYRSAMWKACESKIGGKPEEKVKFFEEVIAAFPECFWMDGCSPPTVRNHVISFRLKCLQVFYRKPTYAG